MGGVTNLSDSNATNDRDESIIVVNGDSGNTAEVNTIGDLQVTSVPNTAFEHGLITVSTTGSLATASGASNLSNRKSLVIFNKGGVPIYYGPSGVTSTTGIPIARDELISLDVGEGINIYLVTSAGTADVIIQEFS